MTPVQLLTCLGSALGRISSETTASWRFAALTFGLSLSIGDHDFIRIQAALCERPSACVALSPFCTGTALHGDRGIRLMSEHGRRYRHAGANGDGNDNVSTPGWTPADPAIPAHAGSRGPDAPQDARRDRYFDLLRAVALARVVAFHMFPLPWLSMVFPAMGVMFAIGGSLMARSMARSTEQAITGRLRRLLPALWVMAAVLVPAMIWAGWPQRPEWPALLLWILPIAEPPGNAWAQPVTGVLWYLVTYLWLVLLSPPMLWLYRRARLLAVASPLTLLAAMDWLPWFPSDAAASVVTDWLTFAACWLLGFAHRNGDLRRAPSAILVPLAAVGAGGALAWVFTHAGDDGVDLASTPLAYGLYSAALVVVLLRFRPPLAWLGRSRVADGLVNLLNARAVTVYLWHNLAITASFPLGDRLEIWRLGDDMMMVGYLGVALLLLVLAVAVVGWVEDLAARRPLRMIPWRHVPGGRPRTRASQWSGPVP